MADADELEREAKEKQEAAEKIREGERQAEEAESSGGLF